MKKYLWIIFAVLFATTAQADGIDDVIKDIDARLTRIETCVCQDPIPPEPPEPEPQPPEPEPETVPLTGYRWLTSDNPRHMGESIILPPKALTGKVSAVSINGEPFARDGLWNGQELWYGPPKHTYSPPFTIRVETYNSYVYEATEGGSGGTGGNWSLPAGLKPGDTSGRAHNNPNAWEKGYFGFVAGKDTPKGSMYIYQQGKDPIKGTHAGDDNGREYWMWFDKGLAAKLSKPVYLVHDKGYYWFIKDPTKKYYGSELKGALPNG